MRKAKNYLLAFFHSTCTKLKSNDFSFDLLLPNEDEEIQIRLKSLVDWCYGFLTGFAFAGGKESDLSKDLRSALTDIVAITTVECKYRR